MPGQAHTRCLMICEFGDYIVANTHFPLSDGRCREAAEIVCVNLRDRDKPVILMGDKAHAAIVASGAPRTIAAQEATDHVALVVDISHKGCKERSH